MRLRNPGHIRSVLKCGNIRLIDGVCVPSALPLLGLRVMPEPQAQHFAHLDDRLLVCRHNGVAHDDVLIGARLASEVFTLRVDAGITIDRLLK